MKFFKTLMFITFSIVIATACTKDEAPAPTPKATSVITKTPVGATLYSEIETGGTITLGNDNLTITERGICWGETTNPTTATNKKITTGTSNTFDLTLTGLKENQIYYLKAYFVAGSVTFYGDQKQLTTAKKPSEVSFLPSAGNNKSWVIQPVFSNEFNYDGKTADFTTNWQDRFFNGWTGALPTVYSASQSTITGGELVYKATIEKKSTGDIIRTGIVTSKTKVGYPMYMEARVKISESSLASAVWMLSEDSTQEIDNLEAYGDKTNDYYSKRLHLSHHVFIRTPFQDYQPSGLETYYADGKGTQWANDYHNYGVLWLDPFTLKYYVDGVLVRTTPTNQIDPNNYAGGTGLTKDMYLIISAASQPWRESQGINYFTDPSVLDDARSTMRVDWIRVYKPE